MKSPKHQSLLKMIPRENRKRRKLERTPMNQKSRSWKDPEVPLSCSPMNKDKVSRRTSQQWASLKSVPILERFGGSCLLNKRSLISNGPLKPSKSSTRNIPRRRTKKDQRRTTNDLTPITVGLLSISLSWNPIIKSTYLISLNKIKLIDLSFNTILVFNYK